MDFMYGLAIQYISVMATGRFIINGLFQTKSKQGEGERRGVEDMEFEEKACGNSRGQLKKKWKF